MTQEAKDLKERMVVNLLAKVQEPQRELTLRAPTGSGKTWLMADFMNRMLKRHSDVVFLVSTLSKGNLAEQNYNVFNENSQNGTFPAIKPHLISTEISGEETLFIPTDCNVYVLPRDLYKKNGKLMQGAMLNFLQTLTYQFMGKGLNKKIYLIKDECHQATNNLDDISEKFFYKVINFSATPKLSRGQVPDILMTDEEAVQAKLIKRVELCEDWSVPVDTAIEKLIEIKKDYNNLLETHPCLIIQISNKEKADEEWLRKIKPAIDKHQELKWMMIVTDPKKCDTNDMVKKRLPVNRWKDYAKSNVSTIDIIVFKMVISEGWDIPRACMLYQVRDTQSKQLDEQVMGRVRRNPRLMDYEQLSPKAQELAMTAWVWGVKPDSMNKMREVTLWNDGSTDLRQSIKVKTTKLTSLTQKEEFDVAQFIGNEAGEPIQSSIFELHSKFEKLSNDLQDLCFKYANGDIAKWWSFMDLADKIKRKYDKYICDYSKSMEESNEVSFPLTSSYIETNQSERIKSWVWCRKDGSGSQFTFDSEAERQWAQVLMSCQSDMAVIPSQRYLWGKNFPVSSEIKYEYYANGIHASYPDFVMKDKYGRIHIFEVKSVNLSNDKKIDTETYKEKIRQLEECYKASSALLNNHIFYLPILKNDNWTLKKFENGIEDTISEEKFIDSLNDSLHSPDMRRND